VIEISPSLEIAAFFETAFGLARAGATDRWEIPELLSLAVVLDEFRDQIYFDAVPTSVQRAATAVLAPVGRRAGYHARDSRGGESSTEGHHLSRRSCRERKLRSAPRSGRSLAAFSAATVQSRRSSSSRSWMETEPVPETETR
jgi:hypothetical protein